MKHAVLGASSAHRWFHCPGSPRLCDGVPNLSSDEAHEGSAAHYLAYYILEKALGEKWAKDMIGWRITSVKGSDFTLLPPSNNNEGSIVVDEEMAEAVDLYLATIRTDQANTPDAELYVEKRFKLDHLYEGLWGTNDAALVQPFGIMRVYDLKYGVGVPVEVSEGGKPNPQLAYYGLGAMKDEDITSVELVVVQPRAKHREGPIRRFEMTAAELTAWGQEVLIPNAKATEDPNAPLVSGDWCKNTFCRARTICPQMRKLACEAASCEFDEDLMPVLIPETVPATEIPVEKLPRLLDLISVLEPFFKDVKAHALDLRRRGVDMGGWKLVETKATRKWMSPTETEKKLFPILKEGLLISEIKSVAQVEKALKASGMSKDTIRVILDGLVEVSRGTTLAPAYDKREEVQSAAVAFLDDLEDDPFAD